MPLPPNCAPGVVIKKRWYENPQNPGAGIAFVYTNCYGHSWEFLSGLVAELKADIPGLKDDQIEVNTINDCRNKKVRVVEVAGLKERPSPEYEDEQLPCIF